MGAIKEMPAQGGTSRSHTSNIGPEQRAGREGFVQG